MATTISLAEAATALHDYFGPRIDAGHDEGHDLMIDALRERFGISKRDASKLIKELEQAHTIRWRQTTSPHEISGSAMAGDSLSGSLTGQPGGAVPLASVSVGGYWQLALD